MGYHWDNDLKVYYYKMKGSGKFIYNYDDPVEFGTGNVDEQQVEDQVHHVDTNIVDTHHDDNHDWQRGVEEHEKP